MKKSTTIPYMIIYARRQQLDFCLPMAKQVFSLPFSPELLVDLTILNPEEYKKSVSKSLAQHKVEKHNVLVVLANEVCFSQPVLPSPKSENQTQQVTLDQQLKNFRESMPFSSVYVRVLKFSKDQQIVGVNRDFFEPLLEILHEQEHRVTTMVPERATSFDLTKTGLTLENGALLAKEVGKLEAFDLLESEEKPRQLITTTATPEEKKRTWLLVAIFLFLLLTLALVYWYVTDADEKERAKKMTPTAPIVAPIVEPVAIPVEQPLAPASSDSGVMQDSLNELDVTAIEATSPAQASTSSTQLPIDTAN